MDPLVRTARVTGLLYLGLAVAGGLGFLFVRSRLFVDGDAPATLANLVAHDALARTGVAVELLTVLTQTLVALWFYRLFRSTDQFAAGAIAVFGTVNAAVVLVSAALLGTTVTLAGDPVGDNAANVQVLYLVSGALWSVGGIFFGLWLIPMGWCAIRSGRMPRALGWVLITGGGGYVLAAFAGYLLPGAPVLADVLVVPATVGEVWMVGYLLVRGIRRAAPTPAAAVPAVA
ncbi:DUF4386 domain-containing protein [Dactylosporangium sp. NPDC005555]|uniref:DUF4386 domain-containing protein n=1 Tax=Dactylosporangium sp. NPDC005555 TaxID=3154889 RepID=UPI00339FF74F